MKKMVRGLLAVVLIGAVVVGVDHLLSGRGEQKGRGFSAEAPVPVLAAAARVADVPVYLVGVGTVRALNLVTVRTQVSGTLVRIAFREGQDVKKGDVLAEIDPTIYKAQFDQQMARKALDQAVLANSKVDLERYANLLKTNAVTRQQYDTQKATIDQQEAQLRVDQGLIDNQRAYLNWCAITSPIDGRTGIRQVDQGNIASATEYRKHHVRSRALRAVKTNCCVCGSKYIFPDEELDIHQPTLSQQLTILREAGIVETRRDAKQIFYRLTDEKAARLIEALHDIFCNDEIKPDRAKRTGRTTSGKKP